MLLQIVYCLHAVSYFARKGEWNQTRDRLNPATIAHILSSPLCWGPHTVLVGVLSLGCSAAHVQWMLGKRQMCMQNMGEVFECKASKHLSASCPFSALFTGPEDNSILVCFELCLKSVLSICSPPPVETGSQLTAPFVEVTGRFSSSQGSRNKLEGERDRRGK